MTNEGVSGGFGRPATLRVNDRRGRLDCILAVSFIGFAAAVGVFYYHHLYLGEGEAYSTLFLEQVPSLDALPLSLGFGHEAALVALIAVSTLVIWFFFVRALRGIGAPWLLAYAVALCAFDAPLILALERGSLELAATAGLVVWLFSLTRTNVAARSLGLAGLTLAIAVNPLLALLLITYWKAGRFSVAIGCAITVFAVAIFIETPPILTSALLLCTKSDGLSLLHNLSLPAAVYRILRTASIDAGYIGPWIVAIALVVPAVISAATQALPFWRSIAIWTAIAVVLLPGSAEDAAVVCLIPLGLLASASVRPGFLAVFLSLLYALLLVPKAQFFVSDTTGSLGSVVDPFILVGISIFSGLSARSEARFEALCRDLLAYSRTLVAWRSGWLMLGWLLTSGIFIGSLAEVPASIPEMGNIPAPRYPIQFVVATVALIFNGVLFLALTRSRGQVVRAKGGVA